MTQGKIDWQKAFTVILFLFLLAYWIVFQLYFSSNDAHHRQIYTFSTVYGIMALWGAGCGILIAKKWGGLQSLLGQAIILFSLGLLAQEFGQLFYSYTYIILNLQSADYPSLGDVGFFGSIPLYCVGIILLGKASGVALRLKSLKHILPAIFVSFAILTLGYVLFLSNYSFDWSNPIKVFLDFGYPLGEAIYISLALSIYILSKGVLGGIMKKSILFIIFALCIQFLADYTFLYQTANDSWSDSGINDLIYLIAYFVMTLGLLQFNDAYKKLKHEI